MKRLIPEYESSEPLREIAGRLKITATTAAILAARGVDTEEKMRAFLSPSRQRLLSPLLMRGMREAVALITQAREEEWSVAVFGDYDADGIGASAILYYALKAFGIEPYLYIPERSDGYGLSIGAIDEIFDACLPDLFITVDCGISCRREVEYIKEQGAYVIVTDHHELPDEIPDCICINPKFQDDYPHDNLCGAGVAYKLASALLGGAADELLDFCALSTVADSVPLTGENRDIVYEGLKRMNRAPRLCFSYLLGKNDEVTSQTLAFTLAPRVNAAGRMGNAREALRLFTSDNEAEISALAEKLNLYNTERQKLVDELYSAAREEIVRGGAYDNVVMATGEWHAGLIGIAAARIAEEFARPALLFTETDGLLHGSARSVDGVNIYEALRSCAALLEEFGGHAQAAGVTLKRENFEPLKRALNEYLGERYSGEDFLPTVSVCPAEESAERVARELNRLEPFGVGNRRPLFLVKVGAVNAARLKPLSPHICFREGGLELMYFNGAKDLRILKADAPKELAVEYNLSVFRGKEYLRGYVRALSYDGRAGDALDGFESAVLSLKEAPRAREVMTDAELNAHLAEAAKERYGLLVVTDDLARLDAFPVLKDFPAEMFSLSSGGAQNTVLFAPQGGDFSVYREIVSLQREIGLTGNTGNARLIVSGDAPERTGVALTREELLEIYAAVKNELFFEGESLAQITKRCAGLGFGERRFLYALAVFEELGLLERDEGTFRVVRGIRTDLNNSAIFTRTRAHTEE